MLLDYRARAKVAYCGPCSLETELSLQKLPVSAASAATQRPRTGLEVELQPLGDQPWTGASGRQPRPGSGSLTSESSGHLTFDQLIV